MKFDKIIMNPPYCRNLHLKILEKAIQHLTENGICVNFAPCVLLTTVRNNWSELAIKKYTEQESFRHLVDCEKLNDGDSIKIFKAGMQQHMGICVYDNKIHEENKADDYAETNGLTKSLIKKIMAKCIQNNIKEHKGCGSFKLPISGIHGHIGEKDFLNIMCLTYDDQLKSKGNLEVLFNTEEDRHAFYDFWMSSFGKLLVSLWKVDTHVMENFIPYFWCTDKIDFYRFFNITEDEQKIIEETIKKY